MILNPLLVPKLQEMCSASDDEKCLMPDTYWVLKKHFTLLIFNNSKIQKLILAKFTQ